MRLIEGADAAAVARARPRRLAGTARIAVSNRILLVAPPALYQDRGTPIALCHVLEALSDLGYEGEFCLQRC
jgi:hypothetical protein